MVVDTGIHDQRWTREQTIDYMRRTTGMALSDVTAEVERYIVMPGQACAYKVGMLKIVELRERAKAQLGPKSTCATSTMWCCRTAPCRSRFWSR